MIFIKPGFYERIWFTWISNEYLVPLGVWISDETLILVFDFLEVLISNETLLVVFDIPLSIIWITDKTFLLLFDILLLVVRISDETFIYVFDLFLLGVCTGNHMISSAIWNK